MATAEERLKIIVEAQDKASQALRGVERQAESLNDTMLSLSRLANLSFAGYGVMQVARLGAELANLAGTAGAVEDRFEGIVGVGADQALERLRASARNTVDDMTLLAESASLVQMGLAGSTAEAAKLVEIATKLRDPRVSAGEALGVLKFMLANQSLERLDTFGVSAIRVRTRINELTSSVAGLTREEAFMRAFLEQADIAMGRLKDGAGGLQDNLLAVNAELTNLKANYAELIFGGQETEGAVGGGAALLEEVNTVVRAMSTGRDVMATFREEAGASGQALDPLILGLLGLDAGLQKALPHVGGLGGALMGVATLLPGVSDEEGALYWILTKVNPELAKHVAMMRALGVAGGNAEKAAKGVRVAREEVTANAIAAGIGVPMDPWLVRRLHDPEAGRSEGYTDWLDRDAQAYADYAAAMERAGRSIDTTARDMAADLRSLAEALLQPTQVTDIDMARTRLGTYTDQWDEYIRRVRSAATDADSAWKHLIPTDVLAKGTDAVKVWAAETEQAFYSGQLPENVDWDAFRQSAEKAVAQEAAREALVNRAMLEVAGLGMGRADVAGLLGVVDTNAVAMDAATQMATGMKLVNVGEEFTDAFDAQFRAEEERYVEMGKMSVDWIATGVVKATNEGAADRLVRYLYNALLPKLQEALLGRP